MGNGKEGGSEFSRGNPEGDVEIDEAAGKAEKLLSRTRELRQTAVSMKINPEEKASEQADLVYKLIEERTTLGPQISELIEQSNFLQKQRDLPDVNEEERAEKLSKINEMILNLQENADELEASIDALANNPYIKAELDKKAGLTDEVKEEIKSNQEYRDDYKLEQAIREEFKQRIDELAAEVVALLKKIYKTKNNLFNLEHNALGHDRSKLNQLVKEVVGRLFKEKNHGEAMQMLAVSDSESALGYQSRMADVKDQQKGWGSGKLKKAIQEMMGSEQLKKALGNLADYEKLKGVSFDEDLERVGAQVEQLIQEIHGKCLPKLADKSRISSVMRDVNLSFFTHLDEAGLGHGDTTDPWYKQILERPGIKELMK